MQQGMKIQEILRNLKDTGCGCHSIGTLLYYFQLVDKYNAIRLIQGTSHVQTCEDIGIDPAHMYRILKVVQKSALPQ